MAYKRTKASLWQECKGTGQGRSACKLPRSWRDLGSTQLYALCIKQEHWPQGHGRAPHNKSVYPNIRRGLWVVAGNDLTQAWRRGRPTAAGLAICRQAAASMAEGSRTRWGRRLPPSESTLRLLQYWRR